MQVRGEDRKETQETRTSRQDAPLLREQSRESSVVGSKVTGIIKLYFNLAIQNYRDCQIQISGLGIALELLCSFFLRIKVPINVKKCIYSLSL